MQTPSPTPPSLSAIVVVVDCVVHMPSVEPKTAAAGEVTYTLYPPRNVKYDVCRAPVRTYYE
jgi:hypothetical protein